MKGYIKAPCLAVFGTGSDVGKSIITTAICRFFVNKGIAIAPFKAQNMSNNSGITPEGLEMGRAQIVQAEAARIPPHVDMNPILLKPTSDVGSQVVFFGKAVGNSTAAGYHKEKEQFFPQACAALDRLRDEYELIVLEGAGSCAEVNLMPYDIVNFRMAEYAGASVILVADIHKGGVFAQIVGTLECLSKSQQNQISGFIINRFRGDIHLFKDGIDWIEQRTKKKVFGVLPWYNHINIEAEDSVVIENPARVSDKDLNTPAIAVIRIPHISNFTDFAPLSGIEGINIYFIEKPQELDLFKAVILPGSKNTCFDLKWLKKTGWADKLVSYANQGGYMLGICGGYQMMGKYVHDPDGLEGRPGTIQGLSLLPVETVLKAPKTTSLTRFSWQGIEGIGYEIHMGRSTRQNVEPMFHVRQRNDILCKDEDGCATSDHKIMGAYIHGLFDTPAITSRWLSILGLDNIEVPETNGLAARDKQYDLLADYFENYVDTSGIIKNIGVNL
ncbi:MAG: cobyric acid synthase [Dissulfuribacterales bacterium]